MKIPRLRLSRQLFLYFSSAFKTMAEGTILGSSAAYFLPEVFQMREPILFIKFLLLLLTGITFLIVGAIMQEKGTKK